ncbi:MAG: hypothetical protein DME24_03860 [Verrucomicrobia bacterium]|nr:MAG: hypothetical protein DME24_03860 [Verrucomicrobiota bacterium]
MCATNKHAKLKELQTEVDTIRRELGISAPKSVLYLSPLNVTDDKSVVVDADGLGGATVRVVEGNYPIDFFAHYEKEFASEDAAVEAAEKIVEDHAFPAEVLA